MKRKSYPPPAPRKKYRAAKPTQAAIVKAVTSTREQKDLTSGVIILPSTDAITPITGADNMLFGITQGVGSSQRIGRQILVKSVHIKGYVNAQTDNNCAQTFAFVLDRQCNGNTLNASQVWVNTAYGQCVHRNLDQAHRYKVLKIHTVTSPHTSADGTGCDSPPFEFFIDNLNISVRYDATGGAITDLTEANLRLFTWGKTGTGGDVHISYRVRYTDA